MRSLLAESQKPSGRGIEAVVIGLLGGAGGYTIAGILLTDGEHMWGGGLILAIGIVFLVSGLLLARVYGVNIWRENA